MASLPDHGHDGALHDRHHQHITYRPDIDGLRAIAVLAVIVFHATGRTGGFVGVDVFFVISGFLISKILFKEADAADLSIARFYERRIRRIIPALTAMVVVVLVVFAAFYTPIDYKYLGQSVAATALFSSNFYFMLKSGYFDTSGEFAPLLHTWSLAVEEQYYVLFPLLVMAMGRTSRRRRLVVLGALAAASLAFCIVETRLNANVAFYLPLTRFWEILTGALIAAAPGPRMPRWATEAVAAAGLVALATALATFSGGMAFPGTAALLPCAGAAALIYSGQGGGGRVHRLIGTRPMVGIGLISYSLYLWHWPVLVALHYLMFRRLSPLETLGTVGVTMAIAYVSYRFVERPFRRSREGARPRLFAMTGGIMTAAVAIGVVLHGAGGLPSRFPAPVRDFAAAALDTNPLRASCDSPAVGRIAAGGACIFGAETDAPPSFALIGDSFADALMPAVEAAAREAGRRGWALFHSGCFGLAGVDQADPACRPTSDAVLGFLHAHPEIRTVIMASRWSAALTGQRFPDIGGDWLITDGGSHDRSPAENGRVFPRALARTLEALAPAEVTLVAFIPEQPYDVPRALSLHALYGTPAQVGVTAADHHGRQAPVRTVMDALGAAHPFRLVDVGGRWCGEVCRTALGPRALYADDNHPSRTGAMDLKDLLGQAFAAPGTPGTTAKN